MTGSRLIQTILVASTALLVAEIVRTIIQKLIAKKHDSNNKVAIQFMSPFLINFAFLVMLPSVVYAALYPVLPFTSYRSGFFIALFVFGVGVLPAHIRNYNQYRLPNVLATFDLFWSLLTLLVVIGSITYMYHY